MTNEIWKPVVDYEGLYEVSNLGRVRSIPRSRCKGKILKQLPGGRRGDLQVALHNMDKGKTKRVALLVASSFLGPKPENMETCHNDGNFTNNEISNLRYDTHQGNVDDQILHGTRKYCESHWNSKLTNEKVSEIKSRLGYRNVTALAREFGVSRRVIRAISTGETWSMLEENKL